MDVSIDIFEIIIVCRVDLRVVRQYTVEEEANGTLFYRQIYRYKISNSSTTE